MPKMKRMNKRDVRRVVNAVREGKTHRGTVRETHAPDKLLLDYDNHPPNFSEITARLRRLGLVPRALYYAPSATVGHWHVVVWLVRPLPLYAVLFAQLWLGSDPERERNGFVRALHYGRRDKYVQILFEDKL